MTSVRLRNASRLPVDEIRPCPSWLLSLQLRPPLFGLYRSLAAMASRPHVFTREQLTSMKRVDIQRICKDYGVRANMKTDALIDVRDSSPALLPPSS